MDPVFIVETCSLGIPFNDGILSTRKRSPRFVDRIIANGIVCVETLYYCFRSVSSVVSFAEYFFLQSSLTIEDPLAKGVLKTEQETGREISRPLSTRFHILRC